jgi:hypothetical protein
MQRWWQILAHVPQPVHRSASMAIMRPSWLPDV